MCDDGMLDYRRIHEGRVLTARVSGEKTTQKAAVEKAREWVTSASGDSAVVLSAEHSLEDNFALLTFAREVLKTNAVYFSGRPAGQADDVLRDADKNPNTAGIKRLAPDAKPLAELASTSFVVSLGSAVFDAKDADALVKVKNLIALASHDGPFASAAKLLLPASTWAEADGSFVNRQGLVQDSDRAITPQGDSKPAYRWLIEIAAAMEQPLAFRKLAELRAAMNPRRPSTPPPATAGAST
jgi:NADH-quinone oxidoreductase subunit G